MLTWPAGARVANCPARMAAVAKGHPPGWGFNLNGPKGTAYHTTYPIQGGPRADRYKWSYNPYKWPYKWLTGVMTLLNYRGL